jgi:hypothetical protein
MNHPFRLPLDASRHRGFTTPLRLLLATTTALWMGSTQPLTSTASAPRQITELRFREFLLSSSDTTTSPVSPTLHQADGQAVQLVGYMVRQERATPGRFLLASRPLVQTQTDTQAHVLASTTVRIELDVGQQDWAVPHVPGLITVNGVLRVNQPEAHTGQQIWLRLQLGPNATHSMNASELTGYLHRA